MQYMMLKGQKNIFFIKTFVCDELSIDIVGFIRKFREEAPAPTET